MSFLLRHHLIFPVKSIVLSLIYLNLDADTVLTLYKVILIKAFACCRNTALPHFSVFQICCRNEVVCLVECPMFRIELIALCWCYLMCIVPEFPLNWESGLKV